MAEEIISLRVGQDLRKRMKMISHINWSSLIRKSIQEQIDKEDNFNLEKAKNASKAIDKLRMSGAFSKGKSGTEIIREWRNKRK